MFSVNRNMLAITTALLIAGLSSACTLRTNAPAASNNNNNTTVVTTSLDPEVSISSTLSSNNGAVAVSITLPSNAPTGSVIYYTTDGSDPTSSGTALIYAVPFVITGNTETKTINAVVLGPDSTASETITKEVWFGEWEFVGDDYLQNIDGGSFDNEASSVYVDASGTYIVSDSYPGKAYKWDGSSWSIAATNCNGANYLQVQNLFVSSNTVYCASYDSTNAFVSKTISGTTTQLGGSLGDGFASIVPCYNTVCAALCDASNGDKATAKIYNADTNSWSLMGEGILSSGAVSEAVSLFSYKNIVYAAFIDAGSYISGIGANVIVKKYSGSSWQDISDLTVKSKDILRRLAIFVYDDGSDDGVVYLSFAKFSTITKPPVVRMYKDGVWGDVGSNGGSVDPTSTHDFDYLNLNVIAGVPYVTYQDYATSGRATTRFFNGASWEDLGSITYNNDSYYTKTATYNGMLYRYVKGWWIESFGPNGSGTVSGGVQYPI